MGWMRYLLFLVALHCATAPLAAQEPYAQPQLRVFHVIVGPGEIFFERFGHNAIWIRNHAAGTDMAYNYGVFDFEQENFIWRFIQGRMLYRIERFPSDWMITGYVEYDRRSVHIQELNLTADQARELQAFLEWNALPENQSYRYDYFRDNCSTRVRDALDRVLGGAIRARSESIDTGRSYRWHTRRLAAEELWLYFSLHYLLGQPTDRPISAWEEMFLPLRLQEWLRDIQVTTEAGETVPLVKREWTVFENPMLAEREAPPRWIAWFIAAGVVIGGLLALFAYLSPRPWWARIGLALLGVIWGTLSGVYASIIAWAWLFTDHEDARPNENILQLSPLGLLLVVLVPLVSFGYRRGAGFARYVALAAGGLALLGFILQVLPFMDQLNGEIIALALPINLALAWSMWRLTKPRTEPPGEPASAGGKKHSSKRRISQAPGPAPT
jgi:hypothetical protein